VRLKGLAVVPLLLLAAGCGGQGAAAPHGPAIDGELQLFTLNRLSGYAEPVPCHAGSVSALAQASVLRDDAVSRSEAGLLLVVGNTLSPETATSSFAPIGVGLRARGRVVLDALAAARPDAWLPGRNDLGRDPQAVLDRAHQLGIPTLVSNLAEGTFPEVLRSFVKQSGTLRVGFIGLLSPHEPGAKKAAADESEDDGQSGPEIDVLPVAETARRLSESLRRDQGVNLVVALSDLKNTVNAKLAESGAVDLIVGGTDTHLEAGRILIVGKSAMLSTLPDGREVGQTRIVIRDGNLQMADLSPMARLPAETEQLQRELDALAERTGTRDLKAMAHAVMPWNEDEFVKRYSRLDENREFIAAHQDYAGSFIQHVPAQAVATPADHPVLVALARQGEALAEVYSRLKRPIPAPPEGTPVIPAPGDCSECHANQVRFWESTAHAKAHTDLTAIGRGRDPTCLTCHAAGFTAESGWYDPRQDAPRGPVTCYSCHKATAVHSANRIMVLDSTQLVTNGEYMACDACHTPARSPGFDLASALPRVSCPKMRDDEPAIVLARERAVEALKSRAERGEAEPLDGYLEARGLAELGREEGFTMLRKTASEHQDNVRLTIETARLFDAHGRSRDALGVLRDYLAVKTGDPDVNAEHVRMLLEAQDRQARDPQEALAQIKFLTGMLEPTDPHMFDYQLLQADALAQLGQEQHALSLLQDLEGRRPGDARVAARIRKLDPGR